MVRATTERPRHERGSCLAFVSRHVEEFNRHQMNSHERPRRRATTERAATADDKNAFNAGSNRRRDHLLCGEQTDKRTTVSAREGA